MSYRRVPEILVFVLLANLFFWPISEAVQPGNFVAFLHDVVYFFDWHVPSEDCLGEFQIKDATKPRKSNRNMDTKKQYSSINFHGGLIEGISLILLTNVHDFYTVGFCGAQS